MPSRQPTPFRTGGLALTLGAAVLLSGCAATVVNGHAAAATSLTLALTPVPDTTPPTPPVTARTSESPAPTTAGADGVEDVDAVADDGGYTDLAPGDAVTIWDDNGEADLYVRSASFTGSSGTLEVTVDYECYDGQCPYYVADWTVSDETGKRYRAVDPSGFGGTQEQIGVLEDWAQKRGHLFFDVPSGTVTVEFGAASGDPATWLVPAA